MAPCCRPAWPYRKAAASPPGGRPFVIRGYRNSIPARVRRCCSMRLVAPSRRTTAFGNCCAAWDAARPAGLRHTDTPPGQSSIPTLGVVTDHAFSYYRRNPPGFVERLGIPMLQIPFKHSRIARLQELSVHRLEALGASFHLGHINRLACEAGLGNHRGGIFRDDEVVGTAQHAHVRVVPRPAPDQRIGVGEYTPQDGFVFCSGAPRSRHHEAGTMACGELPQLRSQLLHTTGGEVVGLGFAPNEHCHEGLSLRGEAVTEMFRGLRQSFPRQPVQRSRRRENVLADEPVVFWWYDHVEIASRHARGLDVHCERTPAARPLDGKGNGNGPPSAGNENIGPWRRDVVLRSQVRWPAQAGCPMARQPAPKTARMNSFHRKGQSKRLGQAIRLAHHARFPSGHCPAEGARAIHCLEAYHSLHRSIRKRQFLAVTPILSDVVDDQGFPHTIDRALLETVPGLVAW